MRTAADPDLIRDRILDAAERLLARHGYARTTVADVAQEAGIGKGSVYLHFSSKEEVFLGTVDRLIEGLLTRLEAVAHETCPVPERLARMLELRVLFRFDGVQAYSQSLDDLFAAVRPGLIQRRERYFSREAALFAAVLEKGRAQCALELEAPDVVARTLLDATNALLPYSLSVAELGARDVLAGRVRRIATLLIRGLEAGRPRPVAFGEAGVALESAG